MNIDRFLNSFSAEQIEALINNINQEFHETNEMSQNSFTLLHFKNCIRHLQIAQNSDSNTLYSIADAHAHFNNILENEYDFLRAKFKESKKIINFFNKEQVYL